MRQDIIHAEIGNMEINSAMNKFEDLMEKLVASEMTGKVTKEAFGQVDIAGYNYAAVRYGKDTEEFPNRIIVGSETYPKDLDNNWTLVEQYPQLIGDFAWTAWDYLGWMQVKLNFILMGILLRKKWSVSAKSLWRYSIQFIFPE